MTRNRKKTGHCLDHKDIEPTNSTATNPWFAVSSSSI
jgi:hypothetical protein